MNCSLQQGLSNCITSMLNSLSTIGSELCELNLHVPIPFPGHLNSRFITSKLFTAVSVYKSSISKASHRCFKCHSIQLLSDSSMKGRPAAPLSFLWTCQTTYVCGVSNGESEGHSLPHVRSLHCQCWRSWASICSGREFSRHFHNADRSEETRSVAIKIPRGEGAGRTPWQKKDWALLLQFLQMQMNFLSATYLPRLLYNSLVCFCLLPGQVTALAVRHGVQLTRTPHSPTDTYLSHFYQGNPWERLPGSTSKQQFGPNLPDCYWVKRSLHRHRSAAGRFVGELLDTLSSSH